MPLLILLLLLAFGAGLAAAFWPMLMGHTLSPATTPTAVVHHQATPTPTPKPTPTPIVTPSPTPVPATPTPAPVVYPNVGGTHSGVAHNTNAGINGNLSITFTQSGGNIGGYVTINPPLQGSGPIISGFVQTNNYIQFVVKGYSGNAPLFFSGTVESNGSMSGQYCSLDSTGHCNSRVGGQGTWTVGASSSGSGSSFTPTESPVAYLHPRNLPIM